MTLMALMALMALMTLHQCNLHKSSLGQAGQAHDGITSEGMTLGRTPMGPGGTSLMSVCFLNSARALAFLEATGSRWFMMVLAKLSQELTHVEKDDVIMQMS
jgi:hypothetical protein